VKILLESAIIAANLALCWALSKHQFNKSYPHFYRYAFFQVFAASASLASYLSMGSTAYSVTYYLLVFFGDVLAICVAAEIAGKLLGPNGALPQWVTNRLMLVMGLGIAATLAVAILLLGSSYGKEWGRAAVSVEHWMAGIVWVTFSAVLLFWRTLKVFRRQRIAASICLGFVLYFTVSVFTVFVRGHRALSGMADSAGIAGMVAYLAMLLWWIGVVMSPAPVFKKATQEQSEILFDEFHMARKAIARVAIIPQQKEA
jgi:hypothetical protein